MRVNSLFFGGSNAKYDKAIIALRTIVAIEMNDN